MKRLYPRNGSPNDTPTPAIYAASSTEEAYGRLVGPPVFKTGERPIRSLAGSIPVRLRHVTCHPTPPGRGQGLGLAGTIAEKRLAETED
jgi:hypothetical protein